MAKHVINAFNGGEVSPSTYARYDQELYNTACIKMENFIPMQAGGAERRPGTKYLSSLSSSTNVIYPFVFNNSNTYNLIFSNELLTIYSDGTLKATLVTPYLESELYELKLTQSADVVFIAHPNHEVKKLSRLSDTEFTLLKLTYSFPPTLDLNEDLTFSISESLKSKVITKVLQSDASNPAAAGTTVIITAVGHSFVVGSMVNLINLSASTEVKKLNGTYKITETTANTFTFIHETSQHIKDAGTTDQPLVISNNSATAREFRTSIPANTTITLTASQNFFTTNDENSEFVLKQKRDNANSIVDETRMYPIKNELKINDTFVSTNGYSDSLNASLSNWSIETLGFWRGKVIIQRSLDGGVTYEDYVVIGDTSGLYIKEDSSALLADKTVEKNFTFNSTEPEPTNSLLRVVSSFFSKTYQNDTISKNFGFILKAENPYILAPCTIVNRLTDTTATAILNSPLIDAVEDYESDTGNCKWSATKNYNKHDKVKFSGKLTELTDDTPEQLLKNGGSALTGVRGSCWDADNNRLLVLVDESGTSKVYAFSSTSLAHDGTEITGNLTADVTVITLDTASASSFYNSYDPSDIAWYDGHIYTWGTMFPQGNHKNGPAASNSQMNRKQLSKFNVDGSHESVIAGNDEKVIPSKGVNQTFGLGFDGSYFYAAYSYFTGNTSANTIVYKLKVRKYNISGNLIGDYIKVTQNVSGNAQDASFSQGSSSSNYNWNTEYLDITAKGGGLYILNNNANKINIYDTSCNLLTEAVSLDADDYRGIGYNPQTETFYTVEDDGFAQGYTVADTITSYYQCQVEHISDNFANNLASGYWVERFPNKVEFFESAFNKKQGFPNSVAIYESRLCFGGTNNKPNTLWLSKTNDLNNFTVGVNANDSMRLTINSNTIDEIQWLCPSSSLVIGTSANEWSLGSGSDQLAITPTQLSIKRKSNYGSSKLQGELVNASVLFFMRQKTKLREWIEQNTANVFLAADLASYADQATKGGILQMAVQTQPETIIWMVRTDGQLIGLTYEKETKTFGWHRHTFLGATVESVSVLPTSTSEDCVYIILKKTDNERCYVKMDNRNWGSSYTTEYFGLDNYTTATKSFTDGAASFGTENDLAQFAGDEVKVKVNGVLQTGTYAVSSTGTLSLTSIKDASGANVNGSHTVVIGQAYTSTLAPLYSGIEFRGDTTRGSRISLSTALVRFKDTLSAKVGQTETNLDNVKFKNNTELNSEDAPCYLSNANEYLQTLYVVQEEPQPCTVLGMILDIEGGK